jgi:hypothetical protein
LVDTAARSRRIAAAARNTGAVVQAGSARVVTSQAAVAIRFLTYLVATALLAIAATIGRSRGVQRLVRFPAVNRFGRFGYTGSGSAWTTRIGRAREPFAACVVAAAPFTFPTTCFARPRGGRRGDDEPRVEVERAGVGTEEATSIE